jgi:hypothetical protein
MPDFENHCESCAHNERNMTVEERLHRAIRAEPRKDVVDIIDQATGVVQRALDSLDERPRHRLKMLAVRMMLHKLTS